MTQIIKADGTREEFSEQKMYASIERAGIPKNLHEQVLHHIKGLLHEGMRTSEIYAHIQEFLRNGHEPFNSTKYSLKSAIMDLGPTGYPFEDYVASVLRHEGYKTDIRIIAEGECVKHEIDVVAEKHTVIAIKLLVEAKFHNAVGMKMNVHVPMYTKSRFDDVKKKHGFTKALVITNTKATLDAIEFAKCVGMEIISWSYPEHGSLRELVEKHQLYPITAITSLPKSATQTLLNRGIVMCKDLCKNEDVLSSLALDPKIKEEVVREASFVCSIG